MIDANHPPLKAYSTKSFVFLLILLPFWAKAQLPVQHALAVKLEYQDGGDYFLNGRKISKELYDSLDKLSYNPNTCKPCRVKYFNESNVLVKEADMYSDCPIGDYLEYDTRGNLQRYMHFVQQEKTSKYVDETGCTSREGWWYEMNAKGDTLVRELWEKNRLIKRMPPYPSAKAYGVEVMLNGKRMENGLYDLKELNNLKFNALYMNPTLNNLPLSIEASFWKNYRVSTHIEPISEENWIKEDFISLLNRQGFYQTDTLSCTLLFYTKAKDRIGSAHFQIYSNLLPPKPLPPAPDTTKVNPFAQDSVKNYYFVNSLKPHKRVYIDPTQDIFLKVVFPKDSIYQSKSVTYSYGNFVKLYPNSLNFSYTYETIDLRYYNQLDQTITNNWAESEEGKKMTNIPIENLSYCYYSSSRQYKWSGVGGGLFMLSSLTFSTGLLASLPYSGGDFNGKRFRNWSRVAFWGFVVSIPIIIGSNEKEYRLQHKQDMPHKDYWYIENVTK